VTPDPHVTAALRPGVRCRLSARARAAQLTDRRHEEILTGLTGGQVAVLERLSSQECRLPVLRRMAGGGPFVDRLLDGGWVRQAVYAGADHLYSIEPVRPRTPPSPGRALSRFTVLRAVAGGLLLESPLAWADLRLHHDAVGRALGRLAGLAGAGASGPAAKLLADLQYAGLTTADGEDEDLRLRQWQPHELWFHHRSRLTGRARAGVDFGATWWADGLFDQPPPTAAPRGDGIPLAAADPALVAKTDPSLGQVLRRRRSIREHDDANPITVGQLGEFLDRCGRVAHVTADGRQVTLPYPTAGSTGGLELYAVVRLVDGLSPGLYHYDGAAHRLHPLAAPEPAVRELLGRAADSAGVAAKPQVLVIISARFGRVMWKYQTMGYGLILKNTGVLFHLMYLVATAMDLAPCALGAGDAELFSRAARLDPAAESSVGEFLLGSRPVDG
jgi:SagB-type dehydrogenase family enzyme